LLGLSVHPEAGGNMFLRNVAWLLTDYTVLYPRSCIFPISNAVSKLKYHWIVGVDDQNSDNNFDNFQHFPLGDRIYSYIRTLSSDPIFHSSLLLDTV
jgi:hypothetical protein